MRAKQILYLPEPNNFAQKEHIYKMHQNTLMTAHLFIILTENTGLKD